MSARLIRQFVFVLLSAVLTVSTVLAADPKRNLAVAKPATVADKVWKEPTTGMEFVWIPKGCFQMGSPSRRGGDEPQHQVCIEGYWLAKHEVTNAQYRMFKPSHDSGTYRGDSLNGDTQPVVEVLWNDAVAFAEWLSSKTGKTFKLPTEAEWEYAARAGTQTAHYWGDDDDANFCRHANIADRTSKVAFSGGDLGGGGLDFIWAYLAYDGCDDGYKVTAPVGRFVPNAFGLYDMLGNVREWTASLYDQAYAGGGSNNLGFRLARSP
ncbi:MAG: formylglycine-generating enzyme family protein [Gammaproteobacteria bacterium]|nr:formylglycine-generating enzyme family protein [Gammaproteobacteria bacterium]